MSAPLVVAYTVVTLYLLLAVAVTAVYAALLVVLGKQRQQGDQESGRVLDATERMASAMGFTVWGLAVIIGLRWPLIVMNWSRSKR